MQTTNNQSIEKILAGWKYICRIWVFQYGVTGGRLLLLSWGMVATPRLCPPAPLPDSTSVSSLAAAASSLLLLISSYSALSAALPLLHARGNHQHMNTNMHTAMAARTATGMMIFYLELANS